MPDQQVILYTYQLAGGQETCHAYGPTDPATAQTAGEKLQGAASRESFSEFTFMVLPLEVMPA